jgi:YVTN family beta-propeller protein
MAFAATLTLVGCGGGNSGNTNHDIKAIIEVPNIGNGTNFSFDISGVDSAKGRMYFTDRNNKSVDVIDTKTNSFIKQITGGFHGCNTGPTCVGADNSKSGPDGLNIIQARTSFTSATSTR